MMDLFSSIQPKVVEPPKPEPLPTSQPSPTAKPSKAKKVKLDIDPKEAYDKIIVHLKAYDIPPSTVFRCKSAAPNNFKWHLEATTNPESKETITRLVVQIEVEMKGQNLDNPHATYWQYTELYRRRLTAQDAPLGMGKTPRKARKATGKRSKTVSIKGNI